MKRLAPVESLMRWRWYPAVLRVPVFIGSLLLIWVLLFGEQAEGRNTGLSVMWVLLWSLQPVVFVLMGRFWCAMCPFGTAGDLVQRAAGNEIHPPLFLKKYGVWFAYAFFIVIFLIETLSHMSSSTAASAILLMTIFTLAMISGAFFKKRTWCRYLCPLGVGGGVFSRLRVIRLTRDDALCNECREFECLQGSDKVKGCPMGLCVKKHDMESDCISCGNCLKSCPKGSPRLHLYSPAGGFLSKLKLSQAESAFASSFIGLSIGLYLVKDFMREINPTFGSRTALWDEFLVIMLFTGISLFLFFVFSAITRPVTRQSQKYNFRFFGFFLIPYIFFVLFNLTSVRYLLTDGLTLLYNVSGAVGFPLSVTILHPVVGMKGMHFVQVLAVLAGSILSILYCMDELNKVLQRGHRNRVVAVFSLFLVAVTGYSLYLLLYV